MIFVCVSWFLTWAVLSHTVSVAHTFPTGVYAFAGQSEDSAHPTHSSSSLLSVECRVLEGQALVRPGGAAVTTERVPGPSPWAFESWSAVVDCTGESLLFPSTFIVWQMVQRRGRGGLGNIPSVKPQACCFQSLQSRVLSALQLNCLLDGPGFIIFGNELDCAKCLLSL